MPEAGDFRDRAAPVAVLRMRFSFYQAAQAFFGKVLLKKEYEQRINFKTRTAAALMAAWNEALKRTMTAVNADLSKPNPVNAANSESSVKLLRPGG